MSAEMTLNESIEIKDAPNIPGLIFRGFRGEDDYPHMVEIIKATREEDETEWAISIEDVTRDYSHLERCDPLKDMVMVINDLKAMGVFSISNIGPSISYVDKDSQVINVLKKSGVRRPR